MGILGVMRKRSRDSRKDKRPFALGTGAEDNQRDEQGADELLTPGELADLLKVSPPTVMSYFRRGIIPAEIAVDRVFRFDREKCLAALRGFSRTEGAADTRDAQ